MPRVSAKGVILAAVGAVLLVTLLGFWLSGKSTKSTAPPEAGVGPDATAPPPAPNMSPAQMPSPALAPTRAAETAKLFHTASLPDAIPAFDFQIFLPSSWRVEAVKSSESLNIYDPGAIGATNLEKSQIFIRHFRANAFITLSSVNVLSRKNTTVAARPAVDYLIEKKPGVRNFPNQPSWRNRQHRVVDVRTSAENPAIFYVFAKRPDLDDGVFESALTTLKVPADPFLSYPVENFVQGVTKKPFGIPITPGNSPVSPERFSGYHTGVDVEVPENAPRIIPVFAVADGVVVRSGKAAGYGGVVALRHTWRDETFLAVYGHLDPSSLPRIETRARGGQKIGTLGKGFSAETDFERPHLHFGIWRGEDINIAGYVSKKEDLEKWADPLEFFKTRLP